MGKKHTLDAHANSFGSTLVGPSSPEVPLTRFGGGFTFPSEQFWGRAARASSDSKESGRPFYFEVTSSQSAREALFNSYNSFHTRSDDASESVSVRPCS